MDPALHSLLKTATRSNLVLGYLFGGIFLFVLYIGLTDGTFKTTQEILSLLGSFLLIFFVFLCFYIDKFRGANYWTELITRRPHELIWVKPITTKSTILGMLTVAENHTIELLSSKGAKVELIASQYTLTKIKRLLQKYTPEAHYGYSKKTRRIYRWKRKEFIKKLKEKGFYHPINQKEPETDSFH